MYALNLRRVLTLVHCSYFIVIYAQSTLRDRLKNLWYAQNLTISWSLCCYIFRYAYTSKRALIYYEVLDMRKVIIKKKLLGSGNHRLTKFISQENTFYIKDLFHV